VIRRYDETEIEETAMTVNTFLVVLAFVFLVLAAFKTPEPSRLSFGWAGMALWMLTIVLGGVRL
jgi:hypothetical protein